MAEEEIEAVVEEGSQPTPNRKYITATFDREADAEVLRKYNMLSKIAGFSAADVVTMGIDAAFNSKQFKDAARLLKESL